ncbi:diguanylate cyclase [Candidatus Sumerlaeota bacterium]
MDELQIAAERFDILDRPLVGVAVIREDGCVLFWNKCLEEWTGIPRADIVGTKIDNHFTHLRQPKYSALLESVFQGGPPVIFSSQLHKHIFPSPLPDGQLRIQHTTVRAVPAPGENGSYALLTVEDVTELTLRNRQARALHDKALEELELRKQTEEKLREANRKILEQQEKILEEERLKVLLQAAGASAHALNQPLAALLGSIELMEIDQDDPERQAEHMTRIEESGQRIAEIVRRIQIVRHDTPQPHTDQASGFELTQPVSILAVEDSDEDFAAIQAITAHQEKIQLSRADAIATALPMLRKKHFDIVFLDFALPDGNGLDFLARALAEGLETPAIVISAMEDPMTASCLIQAGAYDFLAKSKLTAGSLMRVIVNALEKSRLKKDIIEAQRQLAEMSTTDSLTGLFNRRYFTESLQRETSRSRRYKTHLALCMIDLDHFKRINDTHGHITGDTVLTEIGKAIKTHFRETDIPCRYGGEEFAILLPDTPPADARLVAERLREAVAGSEIHHDSLSLRITISAGIASLADIPMPSSEGLVKAADRALYQAKAAGRDKIVVYSQ